MAGKHAPIEVGKYFDIHATAMRTLEKAGRVLRGGDGLTVDPVARGLLMSGRVQCAGGIMIDVTKHLAILDGEGPSAIVQTTAYTYHVTVEGLGNLLRYCGPHDDDAHPDHKPFHHKHSYDVLRGDVEASVTTVDAEDRPTLAEVITEACAWYYEHAAEIEAQQGLGGSRGLDLPERYAWNMLRFGGSIASASVLALMLAGCGGRVAESTYPDGGNSSSPGTPSNSGGESGTGGGGTTDSGDTDSSSSGATSSSRGSSSGDGSSGGGGPSGSSSGSSSGGSSSGRSSGMIDSGPPPPPCQSAADCTARQICCGVGLTTAACQASTMACPSTPIGPVQLCATAAECVTASATCGPLAQFPTLPLKACKAPGDGGNIGD